MNRKRESGEREEGDIQGECFLSLSLSPRGKMVHNSRLALRESRLFREISCAKVANRRESFEK